MFKVSVIRVIWLTGRVAAANRPCPGSDSGFSSRTKGQKLLSLLGRLGELVTAAGRAAVRACTSLLAQHADAGKVSDHPVRPWTAAAQALGQRSL